MTTNIIVPAVQRLAWELVKAGEMLPDKLSYQSYRMDKGDAQKLGLQVEMHGDSEFYIGIYDTNALDMVVCSLVHKDGDYLFGIDALENKLEGIADADFRLAYTANFVDALLTDKSNPQLANRTFQRAYSMPEAVELFFSWEFSGEPLAFWDEYLGNPVGQLIPLAYSGWDSDHKLLLLSNGQQVYELAYRWS